MDKRSRVAAAIARQPVDAVPSGFSLHFPRAVAFGDPGVQSHLDFFRETDTDILKIMNENLVPDVGEIRTPEDWNKIPTYSLTDVFIQNQLELVQRILDKCDPTAFTLGTIHGICASAIHPIEARYGYEAVRDLFCAHIRQNKTPVLEAWKRIAEGSCLLARKYIELGLDGIYYAALGGEQRWFTDEEFAQCIAPFDRQILSAVKQSGGRNFLHICKDGLTMERYAGYGDLVDVVNWGVYETDFSMEQGRALFPEAAIMGGLANRTGPMVEGDPAELTAAVERIIANYGTRGLILGADCTLPTEIPYKRIRTAVDAAHNPKHQQNPC